MIVKTDHPSLRRDTKNHALINADQNALEAYKKRKGTHRNQTERLNNLEAKVDGMSDTLNKILELLTKG